MSKPLVPEDYGLKRAPRPADYLYRGAAAYVRAYATKSTPERAAEKMWGRDLATLEILQRAATSPATTTTTGWAKELAGIAIYDMIQSITSISAGADLIGRGLKLSMDGIAEMRVPGRVLNATAAGQWVAEGSPAPARQLSFSNAAILRPRKLAVLSVYTREMAESSNIEAVVRQTLGEASGLALDTAVFSNFAGDSTRPPGLFAGVTPLTATAGGGTQPAEAAATDIGTLFAALAANGAGKSAVIVAATPQAVRLKLIAGPKFDYDILASTALAAGTVTAIEVGSFVSGFSSTAEFETGRDASVHLEDTSPADFPAAPMKSMFQIDSIALKFKLSAAWGTRAAGHAQWINAATW